MEKLIVATINTGGWSLPLPLYPIVPAPFIDERLSALPNAILDLNPQPDVVLLQEVCTRAHREHIKNELEGTYSFIEVGKPAWHNNHGLMILSKKELRASAFVPFESRAWDEGLFFKKGCLIARLNIRGGTIAIGNVHLVSGGLGHPESKANEEVRARQIEQTLQLMEQWTFGATILGGDFNAGPEASPANFQQLLDSGYANGSAATSRITWDPANALNAKGPHRACPPQSIDHLLTKGRLRVTHTKTIFDRPSVRVHGEKMVTLSDHYGVLATIEWQ